MTSTETQTMLDGATRARLDVVPLLRSYRGALLLARRPPASLALPERLARLVHHARPAWGCHFFATRYVRRRTDALDRALAARTALGEGDDDDAAEAEALRQFRSSLQPPPSRLVAVGGVIAAIVIAQSILSRLIAWGDLRNPHHNTVGHILENVNLNPDVKSVDDIVSALVSANFVENGMLLLTLALVFYVFARPLATGYRLAYYCTGRTERGRSRRRSSPLVAEARGLEIPEREADVARITGANLRREVPFDLLVKAALWLVLAYWVVGVARFDRTPHAAPLGVLSWLGICAAGVVGIGVLRHRLPGARNRGRRAVLMVGGVVAASVLALLLVRFEPDHPGSEDILWLAVVALTVCRLSWLTVQSRSRGNGPWWILVPLAILCGVAMIVPLEVASGDVAAAELREFRGEALARVGAAAVPMVSRAELQVVLTTHRDLRGRDLRGQDMHGMSLAHERLEGAELQAANLVRADLSAARLRGAHLRGAILRHARLSHADLRRADLRCADLRGAKLTGASLAKARLEGAIADSGTSWPTGWPPRGRGLKAPNVLSSYRSGLAGFYEYSVWGCDQ